MKTKPDTFDMRTERDSTFIRAMMHDSSARSTT
jgi:hypothetical protein